MGLNEPEATIGDDHLNNWRLPVFREHLTASEEATCGFTATLGPRSSAPSAGELRTAVEQTSTSNETDCSWKERCKESALSSSGGDTKTLNRETRESESLKSVLDEFLRTNLEDKLFARQIVCLLRPTVDGGTMKIQETNCNEADKNIAK